jgi:hypothetical protein
VADTMMVRTVIRQAVGLRLVWLSVLTAAVFFSLYLLYGRFGTYASLAVREDTEFDGAGIVQLWWISTPSLNPAGTAPPNSAQLFGVQKGEGGFRLLSWQTQSGRVVQTTLDRVTSDELEERAFYYSNEPRSRLRERTYVRALMRDVAGESSSCVESDSSAARPDAFAASWDAEYIAFACGGVVWRRRVGERDAERLSLEGTGMNRAGAVAVRPEVVVGRDTPEVLQLVFSREGTLAALVTVQGQGSVVRWRRTERTPMARYAVGRIASGVLRAAGAGFVYVHPETASAISFSSGYAAESVALPAPASLVATSPNSDAWAVANGKRVFISTQSPGAPQFAMTELQGPVTALEYFKGDFFLIGGQFSGLQATSVSETLPNFGSAWKPTIIATTGGRLAYVSPNGSRIVHVETASAIGAAGWAVIVGGTTYLLALALTLARRRGGRDQGLPPESHQEAQPTTAADVPAFTVPPLEAPEDLIDAIARGHCALFAGSGLSARAGLPTWHALVGSLLQWAESNSIVDGALARSLRERSPDRVADGIMNAVMDRGEMESLRAFLLSILDTTGIPDVHETLSQIGFSSALTTNLDSLLEQTFVASAGPRVYVPTDIDLLRGSFSQNEFFILKLHGSLDRSEPLLVAPAQYSERIKADRPLSEFFQQLFHRRSLFFIGTSVAGIEAFLEPLRVKRSGQRRHYAVIAVSDAGWRADASLLERKYGVHVLPYVASAQHGEVLTFVRSLRERVSSKGGEVPDCTRGADDEEAAVQLKDLELSDIGPFEHLRLVFAHRWTVLLGDNGVGKSSILRAIATALAGEQSARPAGRLLRSGQSEGYIRIATRDGETYVCRVALDSLGRTEVGSEGGSALGGNWLVLAFPAIRTMALGAGRGGELREWRQPPNAADVLPILEPVADPRILDFKQWIINLDFARAKAPALAPRVDAVLSALSSTLSILMGGTKLGKLSVVDNNVLVDTADGQLPLDSLSQGTVSLLGWVGVLVQRLHEISDSRDYSALVLIDEIDAHMHPEWQQAIVARLVEAFPRVQFIVSTHSPFVAVGRRAAEIVRLRRDPLTLKIIAERADRDTLDMTVTDVLTSYLFGLQTAVDYGLQQDVLRLRELALRDDLSTSEQDDRMRLQDRLDSLGVASTEADPLYGRFVEEVSRLKGKELANLPPLSSEAEERQRKLTEQIAREVLGSARRGSQETRP